MGNSIKCCIACMLPCGALDVVRVLHSNGRVEEYSRTVKAGEVMKANPKHVLGEPSCQGVVQKTVVLPPDAELQRGKIYFLIPAYTLQKQKQHTVDSKANSKPSSLQRPSARRISEKRVQKEQTLPSPPNANSNATQSDPQQPPFSIKQCGNVTKLVISEEYLAEVFSERSMKAQQEGRQFRPHGKRSALSRVGVWKPVLESISEVDPL
eukprot:Gb_19662 [translate_table: standard]